MALDFKPQQFQEYFEQAMQANMKAWEANSKYLEGVVKRNSSVLAELADSLVGSVQGATTAKTFAEAVESSLEFEEILRDKLQALYDENTQAFQDLQEELKTYYALDTDLVAEVQKAADEVVENAKKAAEAAVIAMTPAKPATKTAAKKPAPKKATA